MAFSQININGAIVRIQCYLRAPFHPLGIRLKDDNKSFGYIPANLISYAAGELSEPAQELTHNLPSLDEGSYKSWLRTCRALAKNCNIESHEAIQFIVKELVNQFDQRRRSKGKEFYPVPLDRSNWFGKVTYALAEAFDIKIEKVKQKHVVTVKLKHPPADE